jgi:hypothetical protein
MAPVPACIKRLTTRRAKNAPMRNLSETGYWSLVFPTFDNDKMSLPEGAVPCTGRNVMADQAFQGGEWIRKYPLAVEEGELMLGSGSDRLKVLWLRTHKFPDGTEAGPLALVRPKDDSAEVYAVGVYRGLTKRPFFSVERIGPEAVVTISDEGCTGNMKVEPCKSVTTVFLPRRGELVKLVAFSSERRDYVTAGEPGAPGRIEYRLTTSAKYVPIGVKLFEQVRARDEAGRELRNAELERTFTLRDVELVPDDEPLWPKIFPRQGTKDDTDKEKSATGGAGGPLKPEYGCCGDALPPPNLPKPGGCKTCGGGAMNEKR